MENISGTNITGHKSRVTVQHLFIAVTVVAARGGNLTNKNYKIGHAGLVAAQKPFCEKEFIGLLGIKTHAGEMHRIMGARLQQQCHQHFISHQSESSFKSHLVADWCERTLAWLVAPFRVHFANLTPTVQTARSEKEPKHAEKKSNSYTMDHLLVYLGASGRCEKSLGEQSSLPNLLLGDKQRLLNGRDKDFKEQSKSHPSTTEPKRILKRCPCVNGKLRCCLLYYFRLEWNAPPVQWEVKWNILKSAICGLKCGSK